MKSSILECCENINIRVKIIFIFDLFFVSFTHLCAKQRRDERVVQTRKGKRKVKISAAVIFGVLFLLQDPNFNTTTGWMKHHPHACIFPTLVNGHTKMWLPSLLGIYLSGFLPCQSVARLNKPVGEFCEKGSRVAQTRMERRNRL